MVGLSAALIVRDEEAFLEGCLASIAPVVDEIVVVDTGSSDRTPDIARAAGARVVSEPWRDDFAHARNVGLNQVRGDWVLYIDADERLEIVGDLRAVLDDPTAVAASVAFHARTGLTPYPELRLFRSRPDIRFRGVIHETILYDVDAAVAAGERLAVAPARIRHLGYDGDREVKFRRDLPLLERAVTEQAERLYLWHALGEAQLGLGRRDEAEQTWRKALARVRAEDPRDIHVLVYADLLGLHFDDDPRGLADAPQLVSELAARHPGDPLALWYQACGHAADGRHVDARARIDELLAVDAEAGQGRRVGYDRQLFRGFAWGLLGSSWLAEGDPERALPFLRRAEEEAPDNLEVRTKRALAESLAAGSDRAGRAE